MRFFYIFFLKKNIFFSFAIKLLNIPIFYPLKCYAYETIIEFENEILRSFWNVLVRHYTQVISQYIFCYCQHSKCHTNAKKMATPVAVEKKILH